MKTLLPYTTHSVIHDEKGNPFEPGIDSKYIAGGVEKFSQNIYFNVDGVVPVHVSKANKQDKKSKQIILNAIGREAPDVLFFNNPRWAEMFLDLNIPSICVIHEPLNRDIRMVEYGAILKKLVDFGVHLYFVSPNQEQYHRAMAKRIKDIDFGPIKGHINSAYCRNDADIEANPLFDAVTIGRSDTEKQPFLLHQKLDGSDLTSLVMTNEGIHKNLDMQKYMEKNRHWAYPRITYRGLAHDEVMKHLRNSKVYASTCPVESWGITALEALSYGLPLVMFTDNTGTHSSAAIAAKESHYKLIPKNISSENAASVFREMGNVPKSFREEIAEMTREKHSLEKWKLTIDNAIDRCYSDTPNQSEGILEFMNG